jgi:hypothetical protein
MATERKTHKVIDLVYHEDEGNEVYAGTYKQCLEWAREQGFGYKVVPMTKEEIKLVNQE